MPFTQAALLSQIGDWENEFPRVVCDHFFDPVDLDFGFHHIEILSERCQFCDEIVAAPHSTRVDVETDEHTREGLSPHGLDSHIGLWHKAN